MRRTLEERGTAINPTVPSAEAPRRRLPDGGLGPLRCTSYQNRPLCRVWPSGAGVLVLAACLCAVGGSGALRAPGRHDVGRALRPALAPARRVARGLEPARAPIGRASAHRARGAYDGRVVGAVISVMSVVAVGMRPVWSACATSAALQLAVLSPLALVLRAAKGALERRGKPLGRAASSGSSRRRSYGCRRSRAARAAGSRKTGSREARSHR